MADKKISELNSATTPLNGNEEIAIVQSGETKKSIFVSLIRGLLFENATVTGSFDIDYAYDTFLLTLTGNTTLTESNLPSVGYTKVITLHVSGNFAITYPAGWTTYISGIYDGTASLNTIVVEYIKSGVYKVQITQED